jgi:hypothetical protein
MHRSRSSLPTRRLALGVLSQLLLVCTAVGRLRVVDAGTNIVISSPVTGPYEKPFLVGTPTIHQVTLTITQPPELAGILLAAPAPFSGNEVQSLCGG